MKNSLLLFFFALAFSACKKSVVESIQEDLVIKAMTDGQWRVTSFKRDATDVTGDFAPYKFQFRSDKTVEAINAGSTESRGTWNADASAKTISSSFSAGAAPTLVLLNGTWLITRNSWTFVEATQTVNNEVRTLRLDK